MKKETKIFEDIIDRQTDGSINQIYFTARFLLPRVGKIKNGQIEIHRVINK